MSKTSLSPRMLDALVQVAQNGTDFLDKFRTATVKGLETRGYIKMPKDATGYVLTVPGEMYLITNGHMVKDHTSGAIVRVTTGYISTLEKVAILRNYHTTRAFAKFNDMHIELSGAPFIKAVDDTLNNIGRRCNIKGNDDTEARCWEILAEVKFVDDNEMQTAKYTTYLVTYVGETWESYYASGKGGSELPYFLTQQPLLMNLY